MSAAEIGMARQDITRALSGRDLGDTRFTLSEEFTDAPSSNRSTVSTSQMLTR